MWLKIIPLIVFIEVVICSVIQEGRVDYSSHKIVRISPKDWSDCQLLNKLKYDFKNIDFWNVPVPDMRPVLSLIGPEDNGFLKALNSSNIKYEIDSKSFQKVIDSEKEENEMNSHNYENGFDYENKYHSYNDIKNQLHSIATQSTKVTYKSIGKTYEGREIPAIIVTNPGGSAKKTIFLECGIHAREWISTAVCLYMTNKLITESNNNKLLDKFEFIIVPTLNTDGYVYTWEVDRSWRKTRSRSANGCRGTDPNRNWDTAWCKEGASNEPCASDYCGSKPFSEVEVKQMSELIATRKGRIAAYFAFHSFSEYFMYPWGYTHTLPPNAKQLEELSKVGVDAIKASHGLTFKRGNIADVIYLASGSSIDWVYDKCDGKIAFALELRDRGQYGFVLPTTQIKPSCEETWAGVRAVIERL